MPQTLHATTPVVLPGDVRDRRIAIIGMAARFPGAPTLEQYWDNLLAGVVSTTRFTREELLAAGLPASLVDDPAYVPVSGALQDIGAFDADLFGISPAEAAVTDPQQRLFLQVCQQALEHAGYAGAAGRTGVYAGSGMALYSLRTYLRENLGDTDAGDQLSAMQVAIGNDPDFLATRVAYRLGLTGPAVTVRTACSTSLVAVHTAITALLTGDADMALAGAAALHVPGTAGYRYEEGSILSSTGACRAFDAAADGTVGGNGVAAVLLKPLEAALADGDTVHAVILGSAINNDGSAKQGFTWPDVAGQVTVVRDALAAAGVEPDSVGYVEAHGTGTALGDPIEIAALREAFGDRSDPLLVGSVKPNIGHLDTAAGMAGLLKAVLALRAGIVPPQANFDSPNPALRLGEDCITVPTVPMPWPVPGVRRAGVTALGVGGTNAHLVLEQAPEQEPSAVSAPWIVPLSAREPQALAQLAESTADALSGVSPADVLTTLGAGRRRLPHRLVAWGDDADTTARELRAGGSASGVAGGTGPLVFAFAGQGVDCAGAGTSLLAHPASAAVLHRLLDQHRRDRGVDLLPPLLGEPHEWTTETLQPALLAVQLAQVALLAELGVRPDAVVGHSAGEYAALACAAALSEQDAMRLAAARGALMQTAPEGALLAVFADICDLPGLSVAVRNGPGHIVFGGPPEAVADAEGQLAARGVECRRLAADRAFHTPMVDPLLDALADRAAALDWKPLALPVYSGTGAVLTEGTVPGADHVRTHTRSTADFHRCVDELVTEGRTTFIELGPSGVLTALGRQWSGTTWLPLRRRGVDTLTPGLAALFCHGIELDWAALAPGGRRVPLPTYPFQPTRHWIDPAPVAAPVPAADSGPAATSVPAPVPAPEESAPAMPTEQIDDLTELVLTRVRELTAHHLGAKLDRVTPDTQFFDLGADSLLMINLVRELEVAFGVRVTMRELFEEMDTPARLSVLVTERMSATTRAELVPAAEPVPVAPPDSAVQPDPVAPSVQPVAAPLQPVAAPLPVLNPEPQPTMALSSGYEAVVREQLTLMGRFSDIMSEQLAMLSGKPAASPFAPSQALAPSAAPSQALAPSAAPSQAAPSQAAPSQAAPSPALASPAAPSQAAPSQAAPSPALASPAAPAPRRALPRTPAAVAKTPVVEAASTDVGRTTPDFSLYFFGDYPEAPRGDKPGGDKYAAILSAARFADRSGLHAVWLPERHFASFGGVFPNPSVLAAAIAAQTDRVRLHSGSVVLPLHDPIRVAEEWSMVDNLSGGRVSLGVASGWHARDFVLAPQVYGKHREAMYENVETIRALWRGEPVTRTAGNGEQVEVKLYPRPIQSELDFYTAIVGNPDSYRQAARGGFGVITNLMSQGVDQLGENIALYRRTRAEAGLDPDGGRVVLLLHTYLGDDTEHMRAEAFGPFCDYLRSSLSLFGQVTNSLGFSIDLENTDPEDLEYLLSKAYERYCADRALIGTPDDAEPIVGRLAALGVDEVACFIDFGVPSGRVTAGLPHIDRLRSRFTDDRSTDGRSTDDRSTDDRSTDDRSTDGRLDVRDASLTEQQIWYADQAFPGRPNYTESLVVALEGDLDVAALRAALSAVATRHDGLRSTFHDIDGVLKRVVAAPSELALPVREEPGADVEEAARRVMAHETATPFDLAAGPLFAPYLVRLDEQRHLLVLRMHHLVTDTVSAMIMTEEISASYRAAVTGVEVALPAVDPLPSPQPASAESLAYWTALLAGAPRELELPYDHPRPSEPSGRGASVGAELDAELMAALRAVAREHRVTPFTALLAGWALTLRALSGESDLVVGSPFAHRLAGTERAVGFFVHTLPLRITIDDKASFIDVLKLVREQLLGAQEHQDAPLPEIVRALGGNRDPQRNPLFDTVVVYDNEATFELDLPGMRATLLDVLPDRAPIDLVLFLINLGDTVRCRLNHALDLFEPDTARHLLQTYNQVLCAVVADPHRPLSDLDQLDPHPGVPPEAWTTGGPAPDSPTLLHHGVLDHRSDAPAVVDGGEVTTSAQLRDRAAAVAGAIAELEVPAGTPVAVLLPRGVDAVAAMLGVLAAGLPYLPLDPEQPAARLGHMVRKAGAAAVITTAGAEVPGDLPPILMDRLADRASHTVISGHPLTPDDLAYVLFTSGSTGEPKGVLVEHRSISNTVGWHTRDLGVTAADRLSWFCSPGFDASVIEVWAALRAGASLHIIPPSLRYDPAGLRGWLIDTGITIAFVPTPMGEQLLAQPWPTDGSVALRHLVVGGDALHRRPPAGAPFQLWNAYGPTEAAVVSTWAEVTADGDGPPPIGRPVPGTWVRVVDEAGRQVKVGEPGELLIGGVQLARGYAEPTPDQAARFTGAGEDRCYRTGDVVRWSADGELEFLHRSDQQVQIRGFRVEPREAEHQLATLLGVREGAIRAWTDPEGTVRLAAYVVTAPGVTVADLRAELATRLPEYMIPATWEVLDALPLTPNGKLDRDALPEPALGTSRPPAAGRRGGVEQRLAAVWMAELGVDAVPPDATFFELGGHSLTAIRLVNRIRDELGVRLDVVDFLRRPTVRGLAGLLAPQLDPQPEVQPDPQPEVQPDPQPEVVEVEASAPASCAQRHRYAVTMANDNPSVLTIATRFALHGELDVPALHRALTALMVRHPALRTRIREVDGVLRQQVMIAGEAPLKIVDAAEGDLEALVLATAGDAADITAAGTFRATLFTLADCRADLLLTVHHAVSDGWSMGILIRDLGELYRAEVTGEAPDLPELTATCIDFTDWESTHLDDPATRTAVQEWADQVTALGARPLLFPADRPRTESLSGNGAVHTTTLAPELVTAIDAVAAREGATTFAVLIAAFAALGHEVTGAPAGAFLCTVANRPESRFENAVGCFTHSSWVVVPVAGALTFTGLVAAARDAVWQRLALQSVPASVLNDVAGGHFSGNPPKVQLGLYNNPFPDLTLPGIAPAPPIDVELPVARGELTYFVTVDPEGGLALALEYATDLFDPDTVATWANRFTEILTAGVTDPDSKPWHTAR
ncbi:MAG TPA: MupA/Atu3671 family FMN-dependent luciferase-like monooxygenase [Jatrophihabitans sp.]|uniref:MupA/Atu3671 family FMN-dependent luciferase-like monooxygenase n=1 Tax=Jatrophihabitans sp. TaxID=1932789 RepID=UPI002F1AA252